MTNYYKTLEIDKSASKEDIKNAYKKLALKYHPDKTQDVNKKSVYEEKFKQLSEAYEVLSDEQKKNNYDNGQNIIIQNNPFDIFKTTFNFNPQNDNIFDMNSFTNINLSNINVHSTSINTTTQIINNKKITKITKTIHTPNGVQTIVEENIEYI